MTKAHPKSPVPPADDAAGNDAQVQALQQQVGRLTDLAARAQADLQNFKARQGKDSEELRKFANVPLLLKLLPVRDDLARAALAHPHDTGYRQILEKLDKVLTEAGVQRIEARGYPLETAKHEVVNTGPGEKDVVTAVHEEGYELHGRVLRPSKVQVGDGNHDQTAGNLPMP